MAVSPDHPTLVYAPHPLIAAERRHFCERFVDGESLEAYLTRLGLPLYAPLAVTVNDRLVDRGAWPTTIPEAGDLIVVRAAVQGGGGDSSKVLRTVLTIAVLYGAGPLAGTMGFGAFGTTVAQGVIAVGGLLAVNSILPPPTPSLRDAQEAGSPTYDLAGGRNRLRPFAPLPLILGRHIIYPDLGAKEYTEFRGGDQYLHQVFNYGLSDITLSERRIGTTPIASFDEVDIETAGANGELSLFPTNVDTVAGAEFVEFDEWITRTSSVDATALAIDVQGLLYHINDQGEIRPTSLICEAQYRAVGDTDWLPFPRPQDVYDGPLFGDPLPSWARIASDSRDPVRFSLYRTVPKGQYEVRVQLRAAFQSAQWPDGLGIHGTGNSAQLAWSQLRTYQPDDSDYSGQTREALAIRATSQLAGTIDAYNAIAEARCEVWNGTAWVIQHTRNPAWWFRWFAKGKATAQGRVLFGGGLTDARLELDTLIDWAAFCDAHNLTVDMVIDRPMNCDEVLDAIARCGRASKTWGSGKLGVIWDAPDQPVVAVFGMGNIVRSSFEVDYATGKLPDEVIGNFINPDLDWQQDSVRASAPGVTHPTRPLTIDLFGITDPDQAGRAVLLLAAEQVYRRRRTLWETDEEGLIASRGDVVTVSHDLTSWGYSGRLRAGSSTVLTLDRAVPFEEGEDHYIGIRAPDGSYGVYEVAYQAGEHREIQLLEALPAAPDADPDHPPWDYTWLFAPTATPGRRLKIIAIEPLNNRRYRFTAVDDVPEYYAAENNPFTWTPQAPTPGQYPTVTQLTVSDTTIRVGNGFGLLLALAWDVEGDYGGAWVRYRVDDGVWRLVGSTTARQISFTIPNEPGESFEVEVTAFNQRGRSGPDSRRIEAHTVQGQPPPSNVIGFSASAVREGIRLAWDDSPDLDRREFVLSVGGNVETADEIGRPVKSPFTWPQPIPPGLYQFWVSQLNSLGEPSAEPATTSIEVFAPNQPEVSQAILGETVRLFWPSAHTTFPIDYYLVDGAQVDGRVYQQRITWVGDKHFEVVAVDIAGNESEPAIETVTVLAIPAPTNLVATGLTYAIRLALTYTLTDEFEALEIWASDTNDRATARRIGETGGAVFTLSGLPLTATRYFWARVRNRFDDYSDWYPASATGGVEGSTSSDPTDYLDALAGSITLSQFTQTLADSVGAIPGLEAQLDTIEAQLADIAGTPEFDENADEYLDGAVVRYEGGLYQAIQSMTTAPHPLPTNDTYWLKIGDYASIADAVAGHAVILSDHATRIEDTEDGLVSVVTDVGVIEAAINHPDTGLASRATISYVDGAVADETSARTTAINSLSASVNQFSDRVQNPSFETGEIAPHQSVSAGGVWSVEDAVDAYQGGYVAQYNTSGQSGTAILRINGPATVGNRSNNFEAQEGSAFSASCFARLESGDANPVRLAIRFRDSDGVVLESFFSPFASRFPVSDWAEWRVNATATHADTAYATCEVTIGDEDNTGLIWLDMFRVTRLDAELYAGVETVATAIANTDGIVAASYSLVLNANGHLTGYRSTVDAEGNSEFDILASRFRIVNQTDDGDLITPFVVGNIDGNAGVGINGDLVVDGSIVTRHLAAGSVIAANIGAGEVTADKIDVTNLAAISANLGIVTAGDIRAARYRTATTGERIDINNGGDNKITHYVSGSTVVSRIGITASAIGGPTGNIVAEFGNIGQNILPVALRRSGNDSLILGLQNARGTRYLAPTAITQTINGISVATCGLNVSAYQGGPGGGAAGNSPIATSATLVPLLQANAFRPGGPSNQPMQEIAVGNNQTFPLPPGLWVVWCASNDNLCLAEVNVSPTTTADWQIVAQGSQSSFNSYAVVASLNGVSAGTARLRNGGTSFNMLFRVARII